MPWQPRKIANRFQDSSSGAPLGQNHAVSAAPTGRAPHTSAQGVKIEANKAMLVTSADSKGQMLGGMEDSTICGSASTRLVISNSRRSARSPVATAGTAVSHKG